MSALAEAYKSIETAFSSGAASKEPDATAQAAIGESARQFVIFHVQGGAFAVALTEVKEIIRMPDLVRVPMSPPALEGIANLRGRVLPVVNLRQTFGFPPALQDDATRVVVLDQGRAVGLVVDRMANVVTVENDRIEAADTIRSAIDVDLLTGMIKGQDGKSLVMILDTARLIEREFLAIAKASGQAAGDGAENPGKVVAKEESAADEDQLVSFEVAGQEYAFPIASVIEIVQLPHEITSVPNAPEHVLGVITLRNRLLPLVSLRNMFGLPPLAATDASKVVILSLGQAKGGHDGGDVAGVVMDSVREVLRVDRELMTPVPSLLSSGGVDTDITAICRLNEGRRLVSILSAEHMFDRTAISALTAQISEQADAGIEGSAGVENMTDLADDEQFVVFRLKDEEYGAPISAVQEIVRVPDELTQVPKSPAFVEGVVNLRGVVLPVIDQRRRFSLEDAERNDRQRIIVYTIQGVRTGFIVDSVSEVMRIPAASIEASPNLSEEQMRLIRRVANIEQQKRMILLLDVTQLLNGQELASVAATH